jgi:tetratricopeptide (TPR) repeat protein
MIKKTIIFLIGMTLLFHHSISQTFKQQFNDLVSKNDTLGQQKLLEKWENTDINDPELYVAYFNYYIDISKKEIIQLGNNPKGEYVLQLKDKDTSKKEPVGYMYSEITFEPTLLKLGYSYINKGIEKNPTRLDMRFGKIYMYGKTEDYQNFTSEIIKTIDYSALIKNEWTWTDGKPLEDPKKFMLTAIQDYILQLYNTGDDTLLDNMKKISETVLKYYPDHIESLSNVSVVYLLKKDYDKALELLLKAEKLDKKDYIVLSNIAQAYKLKGDNKNSIKYYELTIKYGDTEAKEFAKGQIEELKKK